MVLRRTDVERGRNPPNYPYDNNYMTISFQYEGSFILVPKGKYIGVLVHLVDYVEAQHLTLEKIDSMCSAIAGLGQDRRFYIESYDGKGFILLQKDGDLVAQAMLFAGDHIPMPLFIDAVYCNPSQVEDNFEDAVETVARQVENSIGELWSLEEEESSYEAEYELSDDAVCEAGVHTEDEEMYNEEIAPDSDDTDSLSSDDNEFNEGMINEVDEDDDKIYDRFVDFQVRDDLSDTEDVMDHEIVGSDVELDENLLSDDEVNLPQFIMFDMKDIWNPMFVIGLVFVCRKDFMKAVNSHAIMTRRNLGFPRNDPQRVYAKCKVEDCEWHIHLIKKINESGFFICEYLPNHSCAPTTEVKNMSSTWLAERYLHLFRSDATRKVEGFRVDVVKELRVNVSKDQAYRAKRMALKMLQGKPDLQYTKLWEYAEELRKTNPGSTIILGTDCSSGESRFCRFYVCFKACKDGFKNGCRPIIGVDGCHLKGPHGGVLLTAVGVDANNNIYPVAYAIVGIERSETWTWFLTVLKRDLEIVRDESFTIMSDQQKGLINAISEVFPSSRNRFCVRHILNNFIKAGFRGAAFKSALWSAAKASTMGQFRSAMIKLRTLDEKAADWLIDRPPDQWSWSHFSTDCKSDMLLNNCCESFNSSILEARDKPIITMLEWIREHLMKKLQEGRDECQSWNGDLCPRISDILNENMNRVADCIAIKADDTHYQISTCHGAMYAVDLSAMTCTCRKWELSGIPCHHAISAILKQKRDPEEFVDQCYSIETYKKSYAPVIYPISGQELWSQSIYIPPLPPNFGRGIGRPRRVRRREPDELPMHIRRRGRGRQPMMAIRRQTPTIHCSSCGAMGHNVRACPEKVDLEVASKDAKRKRIQRQEKQVKRNLFGEGTSRQGTEGTLSTLIKVYPNNSRSASMRVNNSDSGRASDSLNIQQMQPPTRQLSQELTQEGKTPSAGPTNVPFWNTPTATLPGPTMYQQMQLGQEQSVPRPPSRQIHSTLNITVPAPMIGCTFTSRAFRPPTQRRASEVSIDGGQKYAKLSNLVIPDSEGSASKKN